VLQIGRLAFSADDGSQVECPPATIGPGQAVAISVYGQGSPAVTALLEVVAGVRPPYGHVTFTDPEGATRQVGPANSASLLRQPCGLIPQLSAWDNVALLAALRSSKRPPADAIRRALRASDVPDAAFHRLTRDLSAFDAVAVRLAAARLSPLPLLVSDSIATGLSASDTLQLTRLLQDLLVEGWSLILGPDAGLRGTLPSVQELAVTVEPRPAVPAPTD
jgi:ABC-type transport system involved in cytochrome c biogenesis ATPase subunit